MRPAIINQAPTNEPGTPLSSHYRMMRCPVLVVTANFTTDAGSVASKRELWQPRLDQQMQEAIELEEVLYGALQHRKIQLLERLKRSNAYGHGSLIWYKNCDSVALGREVGRFGTSIILSLHVVKSVEIYCTFLVS